MRTGAACNWLAAWVAILSVVGIAEPALAKNHNGQKETSGTINLLVYDYAGVGTRVLAGAEGEASRVFARAGVSLVWHNCSGGSSEALSDQACLSAHPSEILVRILNSFPSAPGMAHADTVGFAVGHMVTVSSEKIHETSVGTDVGFEDVLGDVMAHELGHLLMPGHPHSVSGIMRAGWQSRDVRLIRTRSLIFLPAEKALIRANVERLGVAKAGVSLTSVADKR